MHDWTKNIFSIYKSTPSTQFIHLKNSFKEITKPIFHFCILCNCFTKSLLSFSQTHSHTFSLSISHLCPSNSPMLPTFLSPRDPRWSSVSLFLSCLISGEFQGFAAEFLAFSSTGKRSHLLNNKRDVLIFMTFIGCFRFNPLRSHSLVCRNYFCR